MTGIGPRGAAALLSVGLGLTLGVASPRTASHALSFAPTSTAIAASPSKAAVLVDTRSGRFIRVKRKGAKVALADAIGDLNGDGRPDLVTHYNDDEQDSCMQVDGVDVCTAYVFASLRRRNGSFRKQVVYSSDSVDVTSAAIADVNRDGMPELLIAVNDDSNGHSGVVLRLSRGHGRFEHGKGSSYFLRTPRDPVGVALVGRDVVTANAGGTVSVFVHRGGESFAPPRTTRVGAHPVALAVGDLNGDRRPDLAVARYGGGVHAITVLLGRRRGVFGGRRDYQAGNEPRSISIGDLNGDRRPDLVSANDGSDTVSVLLNKGGGAFRRRLDYATGTFPIAVAVGRFNGDKRRDLVIPTFNGAPQEAVTVLTNTPGLCNVQDVWGLRQAAARQTLALAGCGVGKVSHAPSTGFAAGRVIGQTPEGGTVQHGGAVDLTVSDGPGPGTLAVNPSFAAAKSYATPKGGQLVTVADVNGDGRPDVVSGNCGNTVSVLLNQGKGALAPRQDYRVHDCPDTLTLADLNGDGRPDIVAGTDGGTISVLLNHRDGSFATRQDYDAGDGSTYGTNYVAVGDLNGDGKPDLAFGSEGGFAIYPNNGDGTFGTKRDYQSAGAESVAIADLNRDGNADIVLDDGFHVTVVLNRGDGKFEQGQLARISETDASDVFVGDLTGDGNADVVATDFDGSAVDVLLNNGGALRPYVDYRTTTGLLWVAIGDVNDDGTPDLVTAAKKVSVLRNHGDGTFTSRRDYVYDRKHLPRAVALGDLNGDGKLDLVTANGAQVVVRLHR